MTYQDDNRRYYEDEAAQQTRAPLHGVRLELQAEMVALMAAEGRATVVDFGAGPGFDAAGYIAGGIAYVGVDLAHGNGVLARGRGATVIAGSLTTPPLRPGSFDAGICMSTLMHLTEDDVPAALSAMAMVLRPGSPLLVAQWGGMAGPQFDERIAGQRRYFGLRPFHRNVELISQVGSIQRSELMDLGADGWEYHVVLARTAS